MARVIPMHGGKVRMYGGRHAKTCECYPCIKKKMEDYRDRVEELNGRPPPSPNHSIPVKAHWRRRHTGTALSPMEQAIAAFIRGLLELAENKAKNEPWTKHRSKARRNVRR